MSLPTRTSTRRRVLAVLAAAATTASGAALLGPGTSSASSHREAPYIGNDPAVDNTDTYAFVSPDNANNVSLIANWSPFSEPAGGPNFFPWDPDAAYDINVDNNGDAKPDLVYRWTFNDVDKRGAGAGSFLYANGPVTTNTDANLLFRQTYDLTLLRPGLESKTLIDNGVVAPSHVGDATIPDYAQLRKDATLPLATPSGAGKSYVGQADDSFALDLRIFDLLYGGDLSEVGNDTLSGYNVNTVALEVPKAELVAGNDPAANPVIGVWSTTSRKKTRVFANTNAKPGTSATDSSDAAKANGPFVQVSRLGNPLVNEAVVPANLKDFFNRTTPDRDIVFLPKVQDPEVPQLVEAIYGVGNPNKLEGQTNDDKRNDLVGAFLTGFSKEAFAGTTYGGLASGVVNADLNDLNLNAVARGADGKGTAVPAEYLRLNVQVPPSAVENRLGVIGGDLAGFPNGRRLNDDVVDIALQVLEGVLIRPEGPTKTFVAGLGDGVSENDMPFTARFPFIGVPHSGSVTR